MLNHISEYTEFVNESGISYSGGDVTQMPIIGRVTTNPI